MKNKVVAGVIGLIAIVGIVNTHVIIGLTKKVPVQNEENQVAQVGINLSSSRQCLEISPKDGGEHTIAQLDSNAPGPLNGYDSFGAHAFQINFIAKNRCSEAIYILSDHDMQGAYPSINHSAYSGRIYQASPEWEWWVDLNSSGNVSTDGLFAYDSVINLYHPLPPDPYMLLSGNQLANNLSLIYPYQVIAHHIPVYSSRNGSFRTNIMMDPQSASLYKTVKVGLKKVRYFKQSALNDNVLNANEILTANIPDDDFRFISSYAHIYPAGDNQIISNQNHDLMKKIKESINSSVKTETKPQTKR